MNRLERRIVRAGLVLGILAGLLGCQATVATVQVETVGTLAPSYNSIAVAPVHAATPPPSLAFVAGSDDDDVSSVATTVSRADAGEANAAPVVENKVSHGF